MQPGFESENESSLKLVYYLNKTSTTCDEESKNKKGALENQFLVHHVS